MYPSFFSIAGFLVYFACSRGTIPQHQHRQTNPSTTHSASIARQLEGSQADEQSQHP
jgi:hypothetical protein